MYTKKEITSASAFASQHRDPKCYGAAAWRMPLHLLDDQPSCDHLTEETPAYLTTHPLGLELSRGRQWQDSDLKRHIKDMAIQRS
ncbi:g6741 [Coccomyxa elongata]